jgi:hypothetical protein
MEGWYDLGLTREDLVVEVLVVMISVEVLVVVVSVVVLVALVLVALVLVALVLVALVLVVVVLEKVVSVVVAGAFKSQVSHHRDFNNLLNNPLSKNSISHQRGMLLPPSTHGKFTGHLSIPDLKGLWNSDDNKNLLLLNKMLVIE